MFDVEDIMYFDRLMGTNTLQLLFDYTDFSNTSFVRLELFFSGKISSVDNIHYVRLRKLWEDCLEYETKLLNRKHLLTTSKLFSIAESFEEIMTSVEGYLKVDKFSRATTKLPSTTRGVTVNHTMRPGTLEQVVIRELGDVNTFDDRWTEVARYNSLYEIDYDYEGGKRIDLVIELSNAEFVLPVVVDYMFRENLLGKDLPRKLEFENDDFVVLTPERTFIEAVEILSLLEKGDIPEFPNLGRKPIVGSDVAFFAYSSTIRQLINVFRSDPTIESVRINGYDLVDSDVYLSFEVTNIRDNIASQAKIGIITN